MLFLSDILPKGYQVIINTEVGPGSSIAIFGAGPVGLMAPHVPVCLGQKKYL